MIPIEFEGSTVLQKPPGLSDEECGSIAVRKCVSIAQVDYFLVCYKPSYEDIVALQHNGTLYFRIMAQHRYVAVGVGTLETVAGSLIPAWYLTPGPVFDWKLGADQVLDLSSPDNYVWYLIAGDTFPPVAAWTINPDGTIN